MLQSGRSRQHVNMCPTDYASISYVDEHVGAILDTLEATGMADNTLVLFHADVRPRPRGFVARLFMRRSQLIM